MSSKEQSRKTHEATPKRLREARRRGEVPRSKDVVTVSMMIAACIYLWVNWREQWDALERILTLSTTLFQIPFHEAMNRMVDVVTEEFLRVVLPFALLLTAVGVAASVLQFGLGFALEQVSPKLSRVSPVAGMKKVFSLSSLLELTKMLLKVIALVIIAGFTGLAYLQDWIRLPNCGQECVLPLINVSVATVTLAFIGLLIVVAVFDLVSQRKLYLRQQRMTLEEVRQEQKDTLGDPQVRSRRSEQRRQLAIDDIGERIVDATVILSDGAGRIVMLRYQRDETPLPVVLAIESGPLGNMLSKLAGTHRVPIINDARLTHKLMESGVVDQYVPSEFLDEVARVIRQLPV